MWPHILEKRCINVHIVQKHLFGDQICIRIKRKLIRKNGLKIRKEKMLFPKMYRIFHLQSFLMSKHFISMLNKTVFIRSFSKQVCTSVNYTIVNFLFLACSFNSSYCLIQLEANFRVKNKSNEMNKNILFLRL